MVKKRLSSSKYIVYKLIVLFYKIFINYDIKFVIIIKLYKQIL